MHPDLESVMYVVIADITITVLEEETRFSHINQAAQYITTMISRGNMQSVLPYITSIYLKVNKLYNFQLEEIISIVAKFFLNEEYKTYFPALQGVRSHFGPYVNFNH